MICTYKSVRLRKYKCKWIFICKIRKYNDSSLRPVIYDPIIGKFFTTGSAIGGGGSVVISTVSDTAGQTGIDFTLSSGDLSAVASGLDTDDDVAFAQVSASGNLFANLPDGFQNVATYNSQSGQLFFYIKCGIIFTIRYIQIVRSKNWICNYFWFFRSTR